MTHPRGDQNGPGNFNNMPITTKNINPQLWPSIKKLFGETGACGGCWCQSWRTAKDEKWDKIKGNTAKKRFRAQILAGKAHGIVAFDGKEPIGWCAFDKRTDYLRLDRAPSLKCDDADIVWSLPCFFVKKDYRKTGISGLMLGEALKTMKKLGAKIAEGYPQKPRGDMPPPFVWTGLYSTFQKLGFKPASDKMIGKIRTRKILSVSAVLFLMNNVFAMPDSGKISFWDSQKRGANFFNAVEKAERIEAAKKFGIQFIRLAPNKWLNGRPESETGDFLIGRPSSFTVISESDIKYLKSILGEADKRGVKIVLTMLSVPGGRWKQHNNGVEERKIWQDYKAQDTAISFWKQLAKALKGHPTVAGYNIRNEPTPEFAAPRLADWYTGDYISWYKKAKNTPADINQFYMKAVKAIREVDSETPIVLDTGFYATAWGFKVLEPVLDDKIIYSFHMYEPFSFNSQYNKGKYKYPGKIPLGESENPPVLYWDKTQLEKYLEPVSEWQKTHNIPSNRILVGEFGVFRTNAGAEQYLRDVIDIFNSKNWHWSFYSFREDTWAGMDYELGTKKPNWEYWQAIEQGKIPGPDVYKPNTLSDILRKALNGNK